mmetsp:Transcript_29901/g.68937  ORF Transcript_29901/g.68937 Transcript_29901/m.68937 type:complete len:1138 (-) Transcript_29901:118-3531(-)
MELTLKQTSGLPEDSVLSVKIGDVKRQAPTSRLGQTFRFSTSPANPLPLKAELLIPAAAPQIIPIDPLATEVPIDFGEMMKVQLEMREVRELKGTPVDVGAVAQSRGLPSEKLQMAQDAAAYLERHDLVQAFQEILHSLLVTRPEQPWQIVDEHLSRLRKVKYPEEAAAAAAAPKEVPPASSPPPESASDHHAKKERHSLGHRAGSKEGASKVDTLMKSLTDTRANLPVVMPFLPKEMQERISSAGMDTECRNMFASLDTNQSGKLAPADLIPFVVKLTTAQSGAVSRDHIAELVTMFDANEDGVICLGEFTTLVQYVLIATFLETEAGQEIVETAVVEDELFNYFVQMIEEDRERLWDILPFLPEWLVEQLGSTAFQNDALKQFDELDTNKSGVLEPEELIPVVIQLSQASHLSVNIDKCKQFLHIFDVHKNGVIMRDEFVDFVQFLTVMNFLDFTPEGQKVQETSKHVKVEGKMSDWLDLLEQDKKFLPEVMKHLPRVFVDEVTGSRFKQVCIGAFASLDQTRTGVVPTSKLFPLIRQLCEVHPFKDMVTVEHFSDMAAFFDKERAGVIATADCVSFAQYVVVMAYLEFSRAHAEFMSAELLLGTEKIGQLFKDLQDGASKIDDIIPFLPFDLKAEIMSPEFAQMCLEDFHQLDKNKSGVLEPSETIPVLMQLSRAKHFALTDEHCKHFVEMFDIERNGVLTEAEFINFARFILIMAYMETEEGQWAQETAELADSERRIENMLKELHNDRAVVHKVIPFMPEEVFEYLNSQEFILACREKFVELDKDCSGNLEPAELFPVIIELSLAHVDGVDYEHCKRFCKIFDIHGDGVIRKDEFLDFARFLCIMSYLREHEGEDFVAEATSIYHGDKKIQDLLDLLEHDRHQVRKVIPYCPLDLQDYILSEEFVMECVDKFTFLDKDKNGRLYPAELFPVICEMAGAHSLAIDADQCVRFCTVWDEGGTGYLNMHEFVSFARFVMVLGFLKTEDGQKILAEVSSTPDLRSQADPLDGGREISPADGAAWETTQVYGGTSGSAAAGFDLVPRPNGAGSGDQAGFRGTRSRGAANPEVDHLNVDKDFYQRKVERLNEENESLRLSMRNQEESIRRLERLVEEQDFRLRHAEVELKASRSMKTP